MTFVFSAVNVLTFAQIPAIFGSEKAEDKLFSTFSVTYNRHYDWICVGSILVLLANTSVIGKNAVTLFYD